MLIVIWSLTWKYNGMSCCYDCWHKNIMECLVVIWSLAWRYFCEMLNNSNFLICVLSPWELPGFHLMELGQPHSQQHAQLLNLPCHFFPLHYFPLHYFHFVIIQPQQYGLIVNLSILKVTNSRRNNAAPNQAEWLQTWSSTRGRQTLQTKTWQHKPSSPVQNLAFHKSKYVRELFLSAGQTIWYCRNMKPGGKKMHKWH